MAVQARRTIDEFKKLASLPDNADLLDGGEVLPGFAAAVKDIFDL